MLAERDGGEKKHYRQTESLAVIAKNHGRSRGPQGLCKRIDKLRLREKLAQHQTYTTAVQAQLVLGGTPATIEARHFFFLLRFPYFRSLETKKKNCWPDEKSHDG